MVGLTASLTVQVALLMSFASPYQDAYDQADKEGKPLLVLVGRRLVPRLPDDEGREDPGA